MNGALLWSAVCSLALRGPFSAQVPHAGPLSAQVPHAGTRPCRVSRIINLANDTLTVGDVLAGSLSRQITALPDDQHIARAERALDAMTAASAAELDALQESLTNDLQRAAQNTSLSLRVALRQMDSQYVSKFNRTEAVLEKALAPSREQMRAELVALQSARRARDDERRREIARLGVGRSATWRDEAALRRFEAAPKHPIARLCEASALTLSLMLMVVVADFATARHQLTDTVGVASVRLQAPHRTAERRTLIEADEQSPLFLPMHSTAVAAPQTAGRAAPTACAEYWWRAMRSALAVYVVSLGYIVLRSGTDEWAAMALGVLPSSDGDGGEPGHEDAGGGRGRVASGHRRFEYDWEHNRWREVWSRGLTESD